MGKDSFSDEVYEYPQIREPMPPYLGVFRIGSKKWQPHELLAKFLAFADFWRRLKTSHAFSYKTANFRHLFDSAARAPHRSFFSLRRTPAKCDAIFFSHIQSILLVSNFDLFYPRFVQFRLFSLFEFDIKKNIISLH